MKNQKVVNESVQDEQKLKVNSSQQVIENYQESMTMKSVIVSNEFDNQSITDSSYKNSMPSEDNFVMREEQPQN